jgi:hypothetical protein
MATTPKKKRKVGKVMREYKKGTLKSGAGGKGGKVKSRKQAVAIAMSESGQSRKKTTRKTATRKKTTRKTTARKTTVRKSTGASRKKPTSRRTTARSRSTASRRKRAS